MRTFKDTTGREWTLNVTTLTVKQVKNETGVLLTGLFSDGCKAIGDLSVDVVLLVDVIWCICKAQANGITADEFAASLGGDALGDAGTALMHSVADFFTSQDQRDGLNEILDKLEATGMEVVASMKQRIQEIDTTQLAKSYTDYALSSQAS
jgi:hypothetical protein